MLEGRKDKARRDELGKAVPMDICAARRAKSFLIRMSSRHRPVFDLFERLRTVGKVLCYLVEHDTGGSLVRCRTAAIPIESCMRCDLGCPP